MKKITSYVRVTIDYEVESEVPLDLEAEGIESFVQQLPFLVTGNDFKFDLDDLENEAKSRYLVQVEVTESLVK